MPLPAWCSPAIVNVAEQAAIDAWIDGGAPRTLVGVAGSATTSLGVAALLAAEARGYRVMALRLDGCMLTDDIALWFGRELGLEDGLDPEERTAALAVQPVACLLDDADLALEVVREFVDHHASVLWLATGRTPVIGDNWEVEGEPTRPTIDLPPGAEILAEIPMGVPLRLLPPGIPDSLLAAGNGRRAFRRSVRESIGVGGVPSTEALAAVMRDRLAEAEALASDVPAEDHGDSLADIRFFRTVADRVLDPDLAAVAAAAAGRLALRERQPTLALALVREVLASRSPSRAAATALLRWVEGDALADLGEDEDADQAWQRGMQLLQNERTTELASALARRCADAWASRGDQARARRWLDHARRAGPQRPRATADALRIAGNLAAQAGELVGADALFEEGEAALDRTGGGGAIRAGILCGRAMVDLARGQYPQADERLLRAKVLAGNDRLLLGTIAARQAESALRRGRRDDVEPLLTAAKEHLRAAGHARGLLLHARLLGDWHALAGRRSSAVDAWYHGLTLARRTRDLHAARRLVKRILAVEREGNPGPHIDAWQARLDLAEILLRVK